MISRTTSRNGARVTFTVAANAPVSVVGDFNGWDPAAHPLRKRGEGIRSTTLTLVPGSYAFRYLAHGGLFFDDPDADRFESNEHGGIDGVVVVEDAKPAAATKATKATKKKAAKRAAESAPKPRRAR